MTTNKKGKAMNKPIRPIHWELYGKPFCGVSMDVTPPLRMTTTFSEATCTHCRSLAAEEPAPIAQGEPQ